MKNISITAINEGGKIMSSNDANSSNKKTYCILAYVFILWIVGMTQMPQDEDVRFHVNQGIVLTIAGVVADAVAGIFLFIPGIGELLLSLVSLAWLGLAIMGILNANNGVQKELPVIGKYRIYK